MASLPASLPSYGPGTWLLSSRTAVSMAFTKSCRPACNNWRVSPLGRPRRTHDHVPCRSCHNFRRGEALSHFTRVTAAGNRSTVLGPTGADPLHDLARGLPQPHSAHSV